MYRLRRAPGILARTEVKGLSAHFGAGAQVFERSHAAASPQLKSCLKAAFSVVQLRNLGCCVRQDVSKCKQTTFRAERLPTWLTFGLGPPAVPSRTILVALFVAARETPHDADNSVPAIDPSN
jgi:hypothetical protein